MTDHNATNDPSLRSWIDAANDDGCDFPIQNLPFGVFRPRGAGASPRVGVAIGDQALDLAALHEAGLLRGTPAEVENVFARDSLNDFMAMGKAAWRGVRARLSVLLRHDAPDLRDNAALRGEALYPLSDVVMHMPATVRDYTDFYASIFHATNVGSMFRPDNPLLPNYKHVPIGYHGRASSVVVSGAEVRRPCGQTKADDADAPTFGPCRLLDYELEVGAFIGSGNELGQSIPIDQAGDHLFGLCLVNDWSARDMQKWEYQPLGPFLAKSFITTVSPWIVTMDALEPFRVPGPYRAEGDPAPLPYLTVEDPSKQWGVDMTVEVLIASKQMRDAGTEPTRISQGTFRDMYWTVAQMLTHHSSNGCNMQPGDLIASGTVSGTDPESRGCLLERTWRGTEPITLGSGEERKFLADGDEVIIRGWCERDGARRIGFGECRGIVTPAE